MGKKKHIIFTIQTLINNNDNMQNEKCFSKFKREKKNTYFSWSHQTIKNKREKVFFF